MILSVSRRTDIPAFFSKWFMNRIKAGYCTVVNPFNKNQVSYISLKPEDVDVIVFWTKNPKAMLPELKELSERGYRFYFQYTVTGYDSWLEPNLPTWQKSCETFREISMNCPVVWRYDPIIISNQTGIDYHRENFQKIADELKNYTERCVISLVDDYRKASANFKQLENKGVFIHQVSEIDSSIGLLLKDMVNISHEANLEIFSCAETFDLTPYNIHPGSCIDGDYIKKHFDISTKEKKDNTQRKECMCLKSKDIGQYDTCRHGCAYCYAGTLKSGEKAKPNHYVDSPSLLGNYDASPPANKGEKTAENIFEQGKLF